MKVTYRGVTYDTVEYANRPKVSKKVSKKTKKVPTISAPPETQPILSVEDELKQLQLQKAKLEV